MKALIIGLGHPRSGTTSLYSLLDMQQFTTITHESFIKLPWVPCSQYFNFVYKNILGYPGAIVGEVAFYFLNYVPWFANHNLIKFVCMKRDKQDTIKSLSRMFDTFGTNHLIDIRSKFWNPDWKIDSQESLLYRNVFPKYDMSVDEAFNKYYDDYYNTVALYEERYPEHFKVFDMEQTFNTNEGQYELLEEFLKLNNPVYSPEIKVYKDWKE